MASLSLNLRNSEDEEIIKLCLDSISYCIHISSRFDMALERENFVSTLYKFTNLSGVNLMQYKNIESTKLLIKIGFDYGNYLGNSWRFVLSGIIYFYIIKKKVYHKLKD
jgi:brefeldin A-inhibited guanine nucleotide-exchange protein